MMVKFFAFLVFCSGSFVSVSASSKIDQCKTDDAVCVGKVLLDRLESMDSSTAVRFYSSDDCKDDSLKALVRKRDGESAEGACSRIGETLLIDYFIESVQLDGTCMNLDKVLQFREICKKII